LEPDSGSVISRSSREGMVKEKEFLRKEKGVSPQCLPHCRLSDRQIGRGNSFVDTHRK
jgi:hypothetical protein